MAVLWSGPEESRRCVSLALHRAASFLSLCAQHALMCCLSHLKHQSMIEAEYLEHTLSSAVQTFPLGYYRSLWSLFCCHIQNAFIQKQHRQTNIIIATVRRFTMNTSIWRWDQIIITTGTPKYILHFFHFSLAVCVSGPRMWLECFHINDNSI